MTVLKSSSKKCGGGAGITIAGCDPGSHGNPHHTFCLCIMNQLMILAPAQTKLSSKSNSCNTQLDLTMTEAKDDTEVANDAEFDAQDKIVPMETHSFAHTDNKAIDMPAMVNTLAQVVIFSPCRLDSAEGKNGQDWTCHMGENVCGLKCDDMPAPMQQNSAECGSRLAEVIDDNQTMIRDRHMLPCQLLHCILGDCQHEKCNVRPACGCFCAAIRDFLKKDKKEKEKVCRQCIKHSENHPHHIHERPDKQF